MIRLTGVELLKLRTTRLWIVLLSVTVAVVALIVVAVLASPAHEPQARALHDLTTVADVRQLLSIGGRARRLHSSSARRWLHLSTATAPLAPRTWRPRIALGS